MNRAEQLSALAALATAMADPVALVRLLQEATDDADAARLVREAFGLTAEQTETVLDNRNRLLTPAHRQRLADELTILRAEWGAPIQAHLRFTTRRSAVLTVAGTERRFTGGGADGVLDEVLRHLLDAIARPTLRPVVAGVTGLSGGPTRMTVTPSGDGDFEHPG
jgi:hypothetical protein